MFNEMLLCAKRIGAYRWTRIVFQFTTYGDSATALNTLESNRIGGGRKVSVKRVSVRLVVTLRLEPQNLLR